MIYVQLSDCYNYNIPRKIRELQYISGASPTASIITYQEKLGNYNLGFAVEFCI